MIKEIAKHMKKNAYLVLTTPNPDHPVRQRTNLFHKTAWEFKALYALARFAGLKVDNIYRYSKRHPKDIISKLLARWLYNIYRIDWCDSIMIVAKK